MTSGARLTELLCAFESCRLTSYWDGTWLDDARTQKRWTIGWGSTRHDGALVREHEICTQSQADTWRDADIAATAADVNRDLAPVMAVWDSDPPDYQDKFDALVDFTYNEGRGNFGGSTLRRLVLAGDYAGAAEQFQRWTLADGRRSNGLLRRRLAERALFLSDFRPDGSLRTERADFPDAQWYPA